MEGIQSHKALCPSTVPVNKGTALAHQEGSPWYKNRIIHLINQNFPLPLPGIMGVVKGGSYGSGLMPVVEVLLQEGVEQLAVATVAEAVHLRQQGLTCPITVLGESATHFS